MNPIFLLLGLPILVTAQTPTYTPIPTLPSSINWAPSLTPNVLDPEAPNAQSECPGYKASGVIESSSGFTADLTLAGEPCNLYGNDIADLTLAVEYQIKERLSVRIFPKYIAPANSSLFILPAFLTGYPGAAEDSGAEISDFEFTWSNDPSFQFKVSRKGSGEVVFDTYGNTLIFEDQFLEIATSMVPEYNVYGLAENTFSFRLGNNYTQTFYAADAGNTYAYNAYGTHPMYLETRYHDGADSTSHGVYARNAHAQEWLLRSDNITYRTIGGSFDLYFMSGPTAKDVIKQYQSGIVGNPVMQMYWTFGFHQARWGYENWTVLQDVVDSYAAAGIQLECIWVDIDYMNQYRDFTNGEMNFPVPEGQEFLSRLHAAGQKFVPIVDSNIYAPDPSNSSDTYATYERGAEMNAFIRNGNDSFYYGSNWPGFSVWPDFLVPQGQEFWTDELSRWYKDVPFDGIWIDLSEASSFCVGSCGQFQRETNPVHPPFLLPGDPGNIDYRYPEGFNVTNATEAASASAASSSQAAANPTSTFTPTPTLGRATPTPGVRQQLYPPYAINNVFPGHALEKNSIRPNATHNDQFNTSEYEMHNLFGHQIVNATYNALTSIFPGRRPFIVGRSTFAGSGNITSHWGGDNTSLFASMYFSISQALTFAIAGIPMFGADTCGFAGNSDRELCTRWMEMSAFFPYYRNHNVIKSIPQEAYRWATVAEATRRVMHIRYLLLPYMYTLFYHAHTSAETVLRALAWEFPNDAALKAVETQFMLGPALLVTPVLVPLVNTVQGVFPGVADGTIWYDWYSLQPVDAVPGENKTLEAPLEHINVHVRGGSILPLQEPGNTTAASRMNSWGLLVALDAQGEAKGDLYLDDGESIVQEATKFVELSYHQNTLRAHVRGDYRDTNALANITIAGAPNLPKSLDLQINNTPCQVGAVSLTFADGVLKITGLEAVSQGGVWAGDMEAKFSF